MSFNIPSINKLYCQESSNFRKNMPITFDIPVEDVYDGLNSYVLIPLQLRNTSYTVNGTALPQESVYNVGLKGKDREFVPSDNFIQSAQVMAGGQQVYYTQNLNVLNQNVDLYKYNINQALTQKRFAGYFVQTEDKNDNLLESSGFRLIYADSVGDLTSNEQYLVAKVPLRSIMDGICSSAMDLKKFGNTCQLKMQIADWDYEIEAGEVQNDDLITGCGQGPFGYNVNCNALLANAASIIIPVANLTGLNNPLIWGTLQRFPFVVGDTMDFSINGAFNQKPISAIAFNAGTGLLTLSFAVALANPGGEACIFLASSTPSTRSIYVPYTSTRTYLDIRNKYKPNSFGVLMDNTGLAFANSGAGESSEFNVNDDLAIASIGYAGALNGVYLMIKTAMVIPANLTSCIRKALNVADFGAGAITNTFTVQAFYGYNVQSLGGAGNYTTLKLTNFTYNGNTYNDYNINELMFWAGKLITVAGTNVASVNVNVKSVNLINNEIVIQTFQNVVVAGGASSAIKITCPWTKNGLKMWNSQPISLFTLETAAPNIFTYLAVNNLVKSITYNANGTCTVITQENFTSIVGTLTGVKQWPSATNEIIMPAKWELVLATTNQKDMRDGYYTWVQSSKSLNAVAAGNTLNIEFSPLNNGCIGVMFCFPKPNRLLSSTDSFKNYMLKLNDDNPLVNRPVNLDPSEDLSLFYDRLTKGFSSCGVDVNCLNSDTSINPISSGPSCNVIVNSLDFSEGYQKKTINLQLYNGNGEIEQRNYYMYQLVPKEFPRK